MADPTVLSYTLIDELGTKATSIQYINYDGAVETVDGLVGEWAALGLLINNSTSCAIIGGSIKIPVGPDGGWRNTPLAGSRVEQNAIINMRTAETIKRQGYNIPGLINTAIVAGKILTASGPIHALIVALTAGFTNGNFANAQGQDLVAFTDAFIAFRKHRRQVDRSTEVFTE